MRELWKVTEGAAISPKECVCSSKISTDQVYNQRLCECMYFNCDQVKSRFIQRDVVRSDTDLS